MKDLDDVILFLVPHIGRGFNDTVTVIQSPHNISRVCRAPIAEKFDDSVTRLLTKQYCADDWELINHTDCLVLRFSDGARTNAGVIAGRASHADLTLDNILEASNHHLAFTFDAQKRLIVRDLGSANGTAVTYHGEDPSFQSDFDWLLQSPSICRGRAPILYITRNIQFKVIVPGHDTKSIDHVNKVDKFCLGTTDPDELMAALILQSLQGTQLPSRQDAPSKRSTLRSCFVDEKLGSGAFGLVTYMWNVTTGDEFVVKRPLKKHIEAKSYRPKQWEKEANIMSRISHPNIVAFRSATFSPYPEIQFEYLSGGSLETHHRMSTLEVMQILCQLSSALEYLHGQQPAIVHRDIKPENILVAHRDDGRIHVKFADFGLSKASDCLITVCGTFIWSAPELWLKVADPSGTVEDRYTVSVDIWSLGLVIASLEHGGLPRFDESCKNSPVAWIQKVQRHFTERYQTKRSEPLGFVLKYMLVKDAQVRSSADFCHKEASIILQDMLDTRQGQSHDDSHQPATLVLEFQSEEADTCVCQTVYPRVPSGSLEAVMPGTANEADTCVCQTVYPRVPSGSLEAVMPGTANDKDTDDSQATVRTVFRRSEGPSLASRLEGPAGTVTSPDCILGKVGRGNEYLEAPKSTKEPDEVRKRVWRSDTSPTRLFMPPMEGQMKSPGHENKRQKHGEDT
ncbi:hypothetical protein E4U21_002000 [Claviceps maximensis]|nr:hypothetical protein E4U21_002000 [Claviceps maximensis]